MKLMYKRAPIILLTVQFSPLTDWVIRGEGGGGHDIRLSRGPLPVFSAEKHISEQFWRGQRCPLSDVVCPSIASADYSLTHSPRCSEAWFWTGCCGL